MLFVTGTINGTNYEDSVISPKVIAKAFGLPEIGTDGVVFSINPQNVSVDTFGRERFPRSRTFDPQITGVANGESVTVRYATSRTPTKDGGVNFRPNRIGFSGKRTIMRPEQYDMAVFFMLHPLCKQSPFFRMGTKWEYEIYDAEKENKAKLEIMRAQSDMTEAILKGGIDGLRTRAKGMVVGRKTISGAASMSESELRAEMLLLLRDNPADFIRAWNDTNTDLRGMIRDAIDKAIIEPVSTPSGPVYKWGTGHRKGDTICRYDGMTDNPISVIASVLTADNQLMAYLYNELGLTNMAKAVTTLEKAAENAKGPETIPEIIDELLRRDRIGYVRQSKSVNVFDGDTIRVSLLDDTNAETWKTALAKAAEETPRLANKLRKLLE